MAEGGTKKPEGRDDLIVEPIVLAEQPEEVAQGSDVVRYRRRPPTWRERLENTRTWLALALVLTIPLVVIVACVAFLLRLDSVSDIRDFTVAVLGAVTGISGAVVGFYFGEKAGREEERQQSGGPS